MRGSLLFFLCVRREIKGDEEHKIGAENNDAGIGSKFLASTAPPIGHPRPICVCEVCVGCEVDKAEINDELDDLEAGNPLLPPDAHSASALEVIPIHDNVDKEIERNDNPLDRCAADQLGVAKDGGCSVVVAVKEGQRFLFKEEEHRIQELEVFGEVRQLQEWISI